LCASGEQIPRPETRSGQEPEPSHDIACQLLVNMAVWKFAKLSLEVEQDAKKKEAAGFCLRNIDN